MLVFQENPVGFERFCYENNFFYPSKFAYSLATWVNCSLLDTTKFYEVISSPRYRAKQNRKLKFLEPMDISPTRQDIFQM